MAYKKMAILNEDRGFCLKDEGFGGRSLCSANILSADTVSKCIWEMTLRGKGRGMELVMGYVDNQKIDTFSNSNWLGKSQHEVGLYAVKRYPPRIYTNGKTIKMDKKFKFS